VGRIVVRWSWARVAWCVYRDGERVAEFRGVSAWNRAVAHALDTS
jgi:hypothetical protein